MFKNRDYNNYHRNHFPHASLLLGDHLILDLVVGLFFDRHAVAFWVGRCSFAFRFPLTGQLLRLGDLGRGHLLGSLITKFGRWLISVRCRQAVPLISPI